MSRQTETRRPAPPPEQVLERWLVYGVVAALALVVGYYALVAPRMQGDGQAMPTLEPGVQEALLRLAATETVTPTPQPSATPRATRASGELAAPTVDAPTPPSGALSVLLSPSERGVGSFDSVDRLPAYGDRDLLVGRLQTEDTLEQQLEFVDYIGGIDISLSRIPEGSELRYAALELVGLSDLGRADEGTWTVEMLAAEAAEAWADQTYDSLLAAEADGPRWSLPAGELNIRRVNVLEFSESALATLAQRFAAGERRFAFRITGPETPGEDDNVFVWDTGYGPGFGARPALRLHFAPPPPTPGPAPGEPTPLPLVLWGAEPTPAPTATPLPAEPPSELRGNVLFLSDRFGGSTLMVLEPDTGRVGRVTQGWPYVLAGQRQTQWAGLAVGTRDVPCGSGDATIIVDGDPVPNPDPARRCNQIVLSRDGGPFEELTPNGFVHYDPVLSPDGRQVAYVSQAPGNDELYVHDVDGEDYRRLTDNDWPWDKHPTWSPDGSRLAFWSNRDGRQQLYVLELATGAVEKLLESPYNDWDPVWVR